MFAGNAMAPSLADIAAVTGRNNNDGWGNGGDGWWAIIIILALFGGFGGNGWGNGYGNGNLQGALTRSDLCQDMNFNNLERAVRGVQNGICDSTFALNNTITSGFSGVDNAICNLGYSIQQSITNDTIANMQNTNALSTQLANCCCENRQGQADIKYAMATDTCAINTNIHQTGDAIINSQNAGFQMLNNTINDRFTRLEMSQKDQQIAELQMQLNRCDRDSALQSQASYLLNNLNPTPRPAYVVQNPNCCTAVPVQIQNDNCRCGNNFSGCCNG